jgi:endoglucanase
MQKRFLLLPGLVSFLIGCSVPPEIPPPGVGSLPTNTPAWTKPLSPTTTRPTKETASPFARWPDAFEMNRRIGQGVNFGNALEAPNEGEWDVMLHEEYFQLVSDAGFRAVRLPVRWNTHALEPSPFTINPSFFERVDWAVNNALSRGLTLILDFHHFTDHMDCAACERDRFRRLWTQIADHYRDCPPELVFELLNEPTDAVPAGEWNSALASALGVVRASNPYRTVVVGPVNWNSLWTLDSLELPADDRNLIVTFHYYDPFQFTHQGAEWAEGSDAWLGTTWTGSGEEQQAIRNAFDQVARWGTAHNRPIFLGEFGAYERADMASRARWTAFAAREAEAHSFSWAYWEFCAGFGVYDPSAFRWRDPLLRALLPDSPLSSWGEGNPPAKIM